MFRAILVPLDGSIFSEQALPLAEVLARRAHAALHLVQVHLPLVTTDVEGLPIDDIDPGTDRELRRRQRDYLERLRAGIVGRGELNVVIALLQAPVVPAILGYQQAQLIDLIVMTTHGRGGFARMWLGSTADAIVRESTVPVLLQRPRDGMANLRQLPEFRRILVPLDGSPEAEAVLAYVAGFSILMESQLTIMRVVEPFMLLGYDPVLYAGGPDVEAETREYQAVAGYLQQVAQRLHRQGVHGHIETRVVFGRQAAASILQAAQDDGIDAIAMATHGRHGASRMLLGSTADKVIRGTYLPMLAFHPHGTAAAVPTTNRRLSDVVPS